MTPQNELGETLSENSDGIIAKDLGRKVAFNTSRLDHNEPERSRGPISKTASLIHGVASSARHPARTIRRKAAGQVAVRESPYLTSEADEQLLNAHEELGRASTASFSDASDVEVRQSTSQYRVELLESGRDDLRAAWVTTRHVKRVKVFHRNHITYPRSKDYYTRDPRTSKSRFESGKYLGHILLYLSQNFIFQYVDDRDDIHFRRDALIRQAERFIIATDPWQSWLMRVRHIYLWEDPWLTTRWLLLYAMLIKTNYVMTFCYGWVLYIVILNRLKPQSVDSLRASYERSMDHGVRVNKISELAIRHGNDGWLDPLLDEFGPLMQRQLGDLADYLEILINFYHWRNPKATLYAVMLYGMIFVVCAFTSIEFSLRIWWFVCGIYFFFSRPIGSAYPKYRHAVSNLRWIYWDIPTHAELAFSRLRTEAQAALSVAQSCKVSDETLNSEGVISQSEIEEYYSEASDDDSFHSSTSVRSISSSARSTSGHRDILEALSQRAVLSFRGHSRFCDGFLVLSPSEVRFERNKRKTTTTRKTLWSRSFSEIVELRKMRTDTIKNKQSIPSRSPDEENGSPPPLNTSTTEGLSTSARSSPLKSHISHGAHVLASRTKKKLRVLPRAALSIQFTDGASEIIEGMNKRNEAFNSLIGFSGARWMNLPELSANGGLEHEDTEIEE